MVRYLHKAGLAGVVGAAAAAGALMLTGSAGATVVCPKGVSPPSPYCVNLSPIARTLSATHRTRHGATLRGIAGARIANGDFTRYYFQWGRTKHYGHKTATRSVGTVDAKQVTARIRHLKKHKRYHFRIVAFNNDGTTFGSDMSFKTKK